MRRSLVVSLAVTIGVMVVAFAAVVAAGWAPKLGLDLAGGSQIVYHPTSPHRVTSGDVTQTIDILRSRVDAAGVGGAQISKQGANIVVQLPNINNPQHVKQLIGQTAQLQFRPVLCLANPYTAPPAGTAAPTTPPWPSGCSQSQYDQSASNLNVQNGAATSAPGPDPALSSYPNTPADYNDANPDKTVLLPGNAVSGQQNTRFLLGPTELSGNAVHKASAVIPQGGTSWEIDVTLTSSGGPQWDKLAQQQFHAYIGIDLDGQVESAPLTLPASTSFQSFGGHVVISGNFTETTAQDLALVLNYGALPVRLVQVDSEQVSPTLGKSSLRAGLAAGIGGLLLVLLYMIFYYRALGLVVVSGLLLTAGLLWAIVSALGHTSLGLTLDLAGVTGLIVSVGITVDSYIVYFERLKDEARAGRSVRSSVEKSFKGAFRTVLAADLVSLAAAVVLYLLSVGTVRGFAFFLGLSTLLDIFTTYFFTRPLVILLGRNKTVTEARVFGVARGLAVEGGGRS